MLPAKVPSECTQRERCSTDVEQQPAVLCRASFAVCDGHADDGNSAPDGARPCLNTTLTSGVPLVLEAGADHGSVLDGAGGSLCGRSKGGHRHFSAREGSLGQPVAEGCFRHDWPFPISWDLAQVRTRWWKRLSQSRAISQLSLIISLGFGPIEKSLTNISRFKRMQGGLGHQLR